VFFNLTDVISLGRQRILTFEKTKTMKTQFAPLNALRHVCTCALLTLPLLLLGTGAAQAQAQTKTNPPTAPGKDRPVTSGDSTMVRNARVYSIQFPGGSAENFFEFLRTNGFPSDNVLFAGQAALVHVPPFAVRHVRLLDVGKALELVTEGKLSVEVVEKGEQSDENIWRIKASPDAANITSRTIAMPRFFSRPDAIDHFAPIVDAAEKALVDAGSQIRGGRTHMLASEKIVIVVGPAAYVEAVSSALEAAEKVVEATR